ncbi:MAG: class I SAM-dependent methyltransferase [Actinobacteria bacterium]|nr:class I SAM-dependent methyltransferase [Actinomycetota bacterium]
MRQLGLRSLAARTRRAIVDLGCGVGVDTEAIARSTGAHVIGIDRDRASLARAARAPGVRYLCADPLRLPLATATVDGVYSFGLLERLASDGNEPIRAVIREIRRTLRDEGVAILATVADFRHRGAGRRSLTGAEVSQAVRGSLKLHELIGLVDRGRDGAIARHWYIHALPGPAGSAGRDGA